MSTGAQLASRLPSLRRSFQSLESPAYRAARAWMLFLIAVLSGIVFAPDGTARQVYVVDLVGTDRLASAVGLYEIILNVSRVVGPALGGALLATVGVAACCAVNAASYGVPLFVLLRYRPSGTATAARPATDGKGQPGVSLPTGSGTRGGTVLSGSASAWPRPPRCCSAWACRCRRSPPGHFTSSAAGTV